MLRKEARTTISQMIYSVVRSPQCSDSEKAFGCWNQTLNNPETVTLNCVFPAFSRNSPGELDFQDGLGLGFRLQGLGCRGFRPSRRFASGFVGSRCRLRVWKLPGVGFRAFKFRGLDWRAVMALLNPKPNITPIVQHKPSVPAWLSLSLEAGLEDMADLAGWMFGV